MNKQRRGFDTLTEDQRKEAVRQIQTFFSRSHDMNLGLIAAEDVLDFQLQLLGGALYNKGVTDAKNLLLDRFELMGIDLDLLQVK